MATNVGVTRTRLVGASLLGPVAFTLLFAAFVQPRAAHILFMSFALLLVVGSGNLTDARNAFRPRSMVIVLLIFIGYLFVSAAWAPKPAAALGSASLMLLYALLAQAATTAIAHEHDVVIDRIGRALVFALLLGAAMMAFEGVTGQAIMRAVLTHVPALRPVDGGHILVKEGVVTFMHPLLLKRNCTALTLCLWPALFVLSYWQDRYRALAISVALFALTWIASMAVDHETSELALLFSLPVFMLARWRPAWLLKAVVAGWLIATLLVVPIARQAYDARLYTDRHIPPSGQARIILWGFTAREVAKSPWLGTGIGGAKAYFDRHLKDAPQPPDHVYPLTTGPHSHDVYLQTWYELGLVGAVLLLACGLTTLAWIGRQSRQVQPFALAGFVAAAVSAALSWGMWQEWFQALVFLSLVLMRLAAEFGLRHKT